MSTPEIRTPDAIQAELEATRTQMSDTLDQLVYAIQPSTQAKRLKEDLVAKASTLKDRSRQTLADAQEGDPEAMKTIGKVILGVGVVVGLCLLRRVVRGRKSTD